MNGENALLKPESMVAMSFDARLTQGSPYNSSKRRGAKKLQDNEHQELLSKLREELVEDEKRISQSQSTISKMGGEDVEEGGRGKKMSMTNLMRGDELMMGFSSTGVSSTAMMGDSEHPSLNTGNTGNTRMNYSLSATIKSKKEEEDDDDNDNDNECDDDEEMNSDGRVDEKEEEGEKERVKEAEKENPSISSSSITNEQNNYQIHLEKVEEQTLPMPMTMTNMMRTMKQEDKDKEGRGRKELRLSECFTVSTAELDQYDLANGEDEMKEFSTLNHHEDGRTDESDEFSEFGLPSFHHHHHHHSPSIDRFQLMELLMAFETELQQQQQQQQSTSKQVVGGRPRGIMGTSRSGITLSASTSTPSTTTLTTRNKPSPSYPSQRSGLSKITSTFSATIPSTSSTTTKTTTKTIGKTLSNQRKPITTTTTTTTTTSVQKLSTQSTGMIKLQRPEMKKIISHSGLSSPSSPSAGTGTGTGTGIP